ncbi:MULTISPECIES: hypothetical protein [unclassified Microcoleus]|uniref:hypothetical protein n=1 Tax=unclassified Microcoleus TaxID=2642155 RepID=UPI002FCEE89F
MADHILLDTYMAQGFTSIEGWVVPTVAQILKPISEVQLKHGIIGGVVILDDYYNQEWPGVHEGFIKYMIFHNKNLAPFAYHGNKLFLTTISWTKYYLNSLKKTFLSCKEVSLLGYTVLSIKI